MAKKNIQQQSTNQQHNKEAGNENASLLIAIYAKDNDQASEIANSFLKSKDAQGQHVQLLIFGGKGEATENLSFANADSSYDALQQVAQQSADRVCFIDGTLLTRKLDCSDIIKVETGDADVIHFSYQETNEKVAKTADYTILKADYLNYLVSILSPENTFSAFVKQVAKKLDLKTKTVVLKKKAPFDQVVKASFADGIKFFLSWFIRIPIQEMKKFGVGQHTYLSEPSFYRMKFLGFAVILLIGMPIAAFDAGISGDEFVQYKQGKANLDWFLNFGEVTDANRTAVEDPKTLLHLYGSSFDMVTAAFNKAFGIDNEYEWRHALNALTGWLLILFAGLLAVRISGWRAGLLAMFLLFLSPRILGHSWNNPKDIPFAMSYLIGIYYILNYLRNLDQLKFKHVVLVAMAIGASIGIRIGGLLLFAYLFLFTGLYYLISSGSLFKAFNAKNLKRIKPIIISLSGIVILGYIAGILLWPYALLDPIANPMESLDVMTKYGTSIRQLFEGEIVWSDHLPWYYISKYILITTPLVVWIGVAAFIVLFFSFKQRMELFWKFVVFFAFAFPVAYIIYKSSNVYGGWRHALFVYPPLAVCAAIGYNQLIDYTKNKKVQALSLLVVLLLAIDPLIHTFSNHPYQYQYFNEAVGGIDNAAAEYETDYYYHSTREAYLWIKEHVDWSQYSEEKPLVLATNGLYSVRYFARKDLKKMRLIYARYYDRGNKNWDYYLCVNSYINPGQLEQKLWPPTNTDYAVKVDDTPICAVIKRKTTKDFMGMKALEKNDSREAVRLLTEAIQEDPMIEVAYLNLAQAYLNLGQFDAGLKVIENLMKVYPNYDKAYYTQSIIYLNMGKLKESIETSKRLLKQNPKFDNAYYIMAMAYMSGGDANSAIKNLNKCIEGMPNFKPAYQMMAQILQQQGRAEEAKQYQQIANQL